MLIIEETYRCDERKIDSTVTEQFVILSTYLYV